MMVSSTEELSEMMVYSIDELAKLLRELAEMTARDSHNWNNFENICRDALQQTHKAGMESKDGKHKGL